MSQITVSLDVTDITVALETAVANGGAVTSVDAQTGDVVLSSTYQPLDADLTSIAAVSTVGILRRTGAGTASAGTTVSIAEGGTGQTSAGSALSALGGQPLDAGLTSIAALPTAADRYPYSTAADTWAEGTITAAGRAILDDADASAQRTTLGLAAVASSGSASDLATGTLPIARVADGAVTYAKMQDVSATDKVLGRSSSGSGDVEEIACTSAARQVLAGASLAAIRALLGIPESVILSSTTSDTTGSLVAMGDLSFTPEAGCTYFVKVHGVFSAAASTTGLRFLIDPGNATGGGGFRTRGSSSTAQAHLYGSLDGASEAPGTSSATTPGNKTGFEGFGVLIAHATSPTAVSVKYFTEVAGSAVTIAAGDAILHYQKTKSA